MGIVLIGKVDDGRGVNQIQMEEKEAQVSKPCETHYNIIHPLTTLCYVGPGRKEGSAIILESLSSKAHIPLLSVCI
jgi:hypothetical protein